jgi:hypothetical protein
LLTRDTVILSIILTLNSSTIGVPFYSPPINQNAYSKLCFTVILVDIPSFNHQLIYYPPSQPADQTLTNFGIPTEFNPNQSQKCIMGLLWIYNNAGTSFALDLTDTGTPPNSSIAITATNSLY